MVFVITKNENLFPTRAQTSHWFYLLTIIVAGRKWSMGLLFSHQTVVHSIELQATDGHDRPFTDCSIVNSGKIDVKTPFVVEVADWWCNWQTAKNTVWQGGVCVYGLILQSYCFALFFNFILFSAPDYRKVITTNHSKFSYHEFW